MPGKTVGVRQGLGSGRGRACVAGQRPGRPGVAVRGPGRAGIPAGLWSGVRAGSGPHRGSGPHCDGLAPASAPEAGAVAGRPGRGQGHSDQEVGILLLGVCLGNSGSLDRFEQRQSVKELEGKKNQIFIYPVFETGPGDTVEKGTGQESLTCFSVLSNQKVNFEELRLQCNFVLQFFVQLILLSLFIFFFCEMVFNMGDMKLEEIICRVALRISRAPPGCTVTCPNLK